MRNNRNDKCEVIPINDDVDTIPEQVLESALKEDWDGIVIVGWRKEKDEKCSKNFVMYSNYGKNESVTHTLQCAMHYMMNMIFEFDD